MARISKFFHWLNEFQQSHGFIGFPLAIIRKYGEDRAGHEAALLAYYGFLAIFPLLLALEAVLQLVAYNNPGLQHDFIESATAYFPGIGHNIAANVHNPRHSTVALIIGIILALFGAHGVADALRSGINNVWQVPRFKRRRFPKSIATSFVTLFVGGIGFIVAPLLSGFALNWGGEHNILIRGAAFLFTLAFLFVVFMALVRINLPAHIDNRQLWPAAALATIGLMILPAAGTIILTHQVDRLNNTYGTFAIVLGLLFWLYLQSQMLFFALEAASVRALRLWPRSLDENDINNADKRALGLYLGRNQFNKRQHIASDIDLHSSNK
jgi:YihY family inner membrane protein